MPSSEFNFSEAISPQEQRLIENRARLGALADLGVIRTPSQIREILPESQLIPEEVINESKRTRMERLLRRFRHEES